MNVHTHRSRYVVVFLLTLTLLSSAVDAADIVWGPVQQITSETDVSTNGSLVGAFNVGGNGVPGTVVNGVPFQSFAAPGGNGSSGNFTMNASGGVFDNNSDGASTSAPFIDLAAGYRTLLTSYITPLFQPATLTISGLVIGTEYEFQLWANKSSDAFSYTLTASAGNSVPVGSNNGDEGGLGEWVTGAFTADATTQTITFTGDGDGGFLNGFQLRQVPEPSTTALLVGSALAGLAIFRGRRRQS